MASQTMVNDSNVFWGPRTTMEDSMTDMDQMLYSVQHHVKRVYTEKMTIDQLERYKDVSCGMFHELRNTLIAHGLTENQLGEYTTAFTSICCAIIAAIVQQALLHLSE